MIIPVNLSVELPDAPARPPFQWNQTYSDPGGFSRTVPPGFNDGLRDPNGKYIQLQPPISGVGRLDFRCDMTLIVINPFTTPVKIRAGLGVGSVIPGGKPMYPYLGVNHGGIIADSSHFITIPPGEQVMVSGFRKDIVDNDLQSDQPIPSWPNWSMAKGNNGVPPFVIIQFISDPTSPVIVIVENALGEVR